MEFVPFPKIPRLSRPIIITEKIDGTNASIYIFAANEISIEGIHSSHPDAIFPTTYGLGFGHEFGCCIAAASRNRWLTLDNDNAGFAKWVKENSEELFKLGPGHHFGEWWGKGIQRGYGLAEKRFSLFNVSRWNKENLPACVDVVPILGEDYCAYGYDNAFIELIMLNLAHVGSIAAPGFMQPEGIVIYHTSGNVLFKKTFENDEVGKGNG